MIICVTPNVAVDRTYVVPTVQLGAVLRSQQTIVAAGGKGLNVARVAATLGEETLVMGILGGRSGALVAELAAKEELPARWSWADGETRNCAILVGEDDSPETVINDRGGQVRTAEWLQFLQDIVDAARGEFAGAESDTAAPTPPLPHTPATAICICGSLPPGAPPYAPADLIEALAATETPVWIDASGIALAHAIDARPIGIKINSDEAGQLLGRTLTYIDDIHDAAHTLRQKDIDSVIITLGARGAVLHSEQGEYHLRAPVVESVSAVGSGDAFLAGFLVAKARHQPDQTALAWGIAAGAANAMLPGGGILARADFEDILAELQ